MFAASKTAAVSSAANYIEDVFSTYLYTGTGSELTVNNGIDLSTKGGMVWIKSRSNATNHLLLDSARTPSYALFPNLTNAQSGSGSPAPTFTTTGFSVNSSQTMGANAYTYASWTFREQPKFFDIVTFTQTSTSSNFRVNHSLGSVPGCIIIKCTSTTSGWYVYHRSLGRSQYVRLNATSNAVSATNIWGTSDPTSTDFGIDAGSLLEGVGTTYVAYLYAHNAGGFGLTGTDNVISCGSFTTNSNGGGVVNLGYEPQWVLIKSSSADGNWEIRDVMRELAVTGGRTALLANSSQAEQDVGTNAQLGGNSFYGGSTIPTSLGFQAFNLPTSTTYIYIAIRKGPMKVPTDATKVFAPVQYTSATTPPTVTTGFPVDMIIDTIKGPANENRQITDRLRGSNINLYRLLYTNASDAEQSSTFTNAGYDLASNTSTRDGFFGTVYGSGYNCITWNFRRAPSFMDEVCYTGSGSSMTISHNLGVSPQLIIGKSRSAAEDWNVSAFLSGFTDGVTSGYLNGSNAFAPSDADSFFDPVSSTTFTHNPNTSGRTYVAYLFATCAGVSKVGSYTGTGSTQTISCGFTGGARFVLIKRTDSTGDWWVWDTSRGMVSGTDPRLALNIQTGESTGNWVYTTTGGFQIVTTDASVNASGGTYIFLAIA